MNNPIFAGKGVTAHIQHNPAKKHRGQHNDIKFHEADVIGTWCRWQMASNARIIMDKTKMIAVICGDNNIVLSNGRKAIHIKLISPKQFNEYHSVDIQQLVL